MCLEMMPSWCSAGKLRKLWDCLSELRSSVCERRLERNSSEACALACQNCASLLRFSVRYDVTQQNRSVYLRVYRVINKGITMNCWESFSIHILQKQDILTLIPLTWKIGWDPNNDSRWQMGFNSAFKGLIDDQKVNDLNPPYELARDIALPN